MDYYCFDLIFPGKLIDFVSPNESDGTHKFHAHLYANESNIELRIYFREDLQTQEFSSWLYSSGLEKAFARCKVVNINEENNTQIIDFSNSIIVGFSYGGNQIDNELGEYIKINLSTVRIFKNPSKFKHNTADFYLNSVGFNLVKDFHSILFGNNGEFSIKRMKGYEDFYQFEDIRFRPEFEFYTKDARKEIKAIIEKKPKISFSFPEETSENDVLECAEIIRLLASFYMQNNIEYNYSKIHLNTSTLIIYKLKGGDYQISKTGLFHFGLFWNFNKLMLSDWQTSAKDNYKLLSKIIPLFVQSMLVDQHSSLLIRYNIIEYCMGKFKTEKQNFPLGLNENDVEEKYLSACNLFLETIDKRYHKEFLDKWKYQLNKLKLRPEKSLWAEYLISKNIILPDTFTVDKIKQIRDSITHGSLKRVKEEDIERVNTLMYGISGLLILKHLNIHEGSLERIIEHLNNAN